MAKKDASSSEGGAATAAPPKPASSGSSSAPAEPKQPVWSKEVKGTKAVIWENEHDGRIFFSFGISRRYLDKKTDEWKDSSSWPDSDADLFDLVCDAMKSELTRLRDELRASGRNESTNGPTAF